jgi:hypothetical protein
MCPTRAAPALQDLAGGQVDFAILPYQASFEGMAKQGRLKILTSFSKVLPKELTHVPLISQSRLSPDFEYTVSAGYFVKKGTPADRVAALRSAIGQALVNPEIRAKLELEGKHLRQPVASQARGGPELPCHPSAPERAGAQRGPKASGLRHGLPRLAVQAHEQSLINTQAMGPVKHAQSSHDWCRSPAGRQGA